jgi:TIR domain
VRGDASFEKSRYHVQMKFQLFISHDSRDRVAADQVKSILEQTFLNCKVFVSSSDLVGGDVFVEQIRTHLKESVAIISIISRLSKDNLWVLFESGAGFLDKKTIPILFENLDFSDLPKPLQMLQSRKFDSAGINALLADVSHIAKLRKPSNIPDYSENIAVVNTFFEERDEKVVFDEECRTKFQEIYMLSHVALIGYILTNIPSDSRPDFEELKKLRVSDLRAIARPENPFELPGSTMLLDRTDVPLSNAPEWQKSVFLRDMAKSEPEIRAFYAKYVPEDENSFTRNNHCVQPKNTVLDAFSRAFTNIVQDDLFQSEGRRVRVNSPSHKRSPATETCTGGGAGVRSYPIGLSACMR